MHLQVSPVPGWPGSAPSPAGPSGPLTSGEDSRGGDSGGTVACPPVHCVCELTRQLKALEEPERSG